MENRENRFPPSHPTRIYEDECVQSEGRSSGYNMRKCNSRREQCPRPDVSMLPDDSCLLPTWRQSFHYGPVPQLLSDRHRICSSSRYHLRNRRFQAAPLKLGSLHRTLQTYIHSLTGLRRTMTQKRTSFDYEKVIGEIARRMPILFRYDCSVSSL